MATLQQIYNVAHSTLLAPRVAGALYKAAASIRAEAAGTANHANRLLWANGVMKEDQNGPMVKRFLVFCAQNATIAGAGGEATDNDLDYVVALFINQEADGIYGT
jgi:hypothetical protein